MKPDEILDRFINAIEEIYSGMDPRTFWPLNGGQVDAYFDVTEALDMYYRINKLKEKHSLEEIADLLPEPDIIRLFIEHNAIIGLKVAKKLKIAEISTKEIIDYTLFLFKILEKKTHNDIFCSDGKNILYSEKEFQEIISDTNWEKVNSNEDKKDIAYLAVVSNNLCYSLYYDIYMTGGFYIHGPYDVSEKFGPGSILLVRDYHNIQPKELWPDLKMPYKKMRIMNIYQGLDIKLNYTNHPDSEQSIGDKLISYKILLDNKEINFDEIEQIVNTFESVSANQIKRIKALSDLDKVRKGAEIAYYLFRNIRRFMGDGWKPDAIVEQTIQKFGDKFIKQFRYKEKPSLDHWKKLYDPRNDYF